MDDKLKEKAERGVIDNMLSTAQNALAVGAGAVLLYRAGGRKFLSEASEVSSRVLGGVREDLAGISGRKIETTDIKRIYDRAFKGDDSLYRQARTAINEPGNMRIRANNTATHLGKMANAVSQIANNGPERLARRQFDFDRIINPTAIEFAQKLASDRETAFGVKQFVEKLSRTNDDLTEALAARKRYKLDEVVSHEDIQDILTKLKERKSQSDPDFNAYVKQLKDVPKKLEEELFGIDSLEKEANRKKLLSTALGDRAITYGDVISNPERFRGTRMSWTAEREGEKRTVETDAVEFVQYLESRVRQRNKGKEEEALSLFRRISPDEMIRKDEAGNIYNMTGIGDIRDKALDSFAGTMPGKIFKIRGIRERQKAPSMEVFSPSMSRISPLLAKYLNDEERKHIDSIEKTAISIMGKNFALEASGKLRHIKELDDTFLMSQYGATPRMYKSMLGHEAYRKTSGNKVADYFDVFKEGQMHIGDVVSSMFKKKETPTWSGNALDAVGRNIGNTFDEIQEARNALAEASIIRTMSSSNESLVRAKMLETKATEKAVELFEQIKVVESIYRKNSYAPSKMDTLRLANGMTGKARDFMELASKSDDDLIQSILSRPDLYSKDMWNQDLSKILEDYKRDPRKAMSMMSIKEDRYGEKGIRYLETNQADKFSELLRTELSKESLMRHGNEHGFGDVRRLIGETDISGRSKQNANRLVDWAILQGDSGIYQSIRQNGKMANASSILDKTEEALSSYKAGAMAGEGTFYRQYYDNAIALRKDAVNEMGGDYGVAMDNPNIVNSMEQTEYMHMRKFISPLDVIRGVNEGHTWKAFGKQFTAGRHDVENVTNGTMVPYFFLSRLSDALSPIGLSFSAENKGSSLDLVKAMALKRGLPIVAGLHALEYGNDMMGVLTGQSAAAAFFSGVANVDLGIRGVLDGTGIGDFIQTEKDLNPFLRYWTGDEYLNAEEKAEWYQNGYSEMRKGRWWSFGGIQEFRGSQIQYYQPNFLRRTTSNWKDEAIYNNVWDKWSHSWIPTPTNPLSPLVYLADPYWMERRFSEERPYPMTGKMFTEETPWGPILNATVGEVIKPQRRMHTDRLDENFVDSKMLIEAENRAIYEKAKNQGGGHLVRFKEGAIEAVTYTDINSPTPSTRIVSLGGGGASIPGAYGQAPEGVTYAGDLSGDHPLTDSALAAIGVTGPSGETTGGTGYIPVEDLSAIDKIEISAASGNVFAQITNAAIGATALKEISSVNEQIRGRASVNNRFASSGSIGDGVVTTESIYRAGASFGQSVLEDADTLAELKGLSSGDDFLGEMAYTLRFAAGIYGYGAFAMFPGQPKTKLADAGDITSPVRGFWDANLGGLGGGYLEIFRRFIPAANHKQNDFNPLLNAMPDWMPEKFRFGDPFTALPKGEMRLPGRGYESLNELHPDQYGEYGAFDRMKILADIAPTSHEYKVWKEIAEKTVSNPYLQNEIEDIQERVKKQNQTYDFFDYRFLGRGVDKEVAYVDEIVGNDKFTVVGSDQVYRMAGLKMKKDGLKSYLESGMQIELLTDSNEYTGRNDDPQQSINAAVMVGGMNLNKTLLDKEVAERRQDTSSASVMANYTGFQIMRGKAYEALSHLNVPYFSQKFFRIRDPLESWKQEMTYGTSYATWAAPIDTFLKPAFERALMSDTEILVGTGVAVAANKVINNSESKIARASSMAALALTNRGAFIGAFMGIASGNNASFTNKAMLAGSAAQILGWAVTRRDNILEGTIGSAIIGAGVGHMLGDVGWKKGGKIGALVGLAVTGSNASLLSDGISPEWIPERTKDKWEAQEYFDRLNYLKYETLYEKSARLAERKEGTDIRELVKAYDKSQEENHELRERLTEARNIVARAYGESSERGQHLLSEINSRLDQINAQEFVLSVGEYGKSALMYKQMMDSTVYGLGKDASWAELVRAVPQNERSHFIEFMKEKDPKKREDILKYVSPYTQKVLKIAWGEEYDDPESNASFFQDRNLPAPTWSGWKPNVDLRDVQLKTIQNEGMLLADFGFYESQLRDPDVINAPNLDMNTQKDPARTFMNLSQTLRNLGLTGVNVSVSPSTRTGVEVVANIVNTAVNAPEYLENKIKNVMTI